MDNNINKILQSSPSRKAKLKNRKDLRIKLTKLSNRYFKPRCEHFINNMRSLNFRILESSGGKKSIDKEVKESRNFRFGKTKDYFIHLTDLSPYKVQLSPFINTLKNEFSKEEINIIKKDKDYYIQNQFIKDNVTLFNEQSLYQVLNNEEKEEEIARNNMKVYRDLNYFNKRRKSVIYGINNISINFNNTLNKSESKNINDKKLLFRSSKLNNKTNNLNENNDVSDYILKRNRLDIIEKDIRKAVKKRRKEDKKINLINEKTKNIVYDMSKESKSEIKRILDDENVKKYYNYDYYITNQLISFNKKHHNLDELQNQTELSFPLLNNIQNLSKTVSPIKHKNRNNFLSTINYTLKNNNNYKDDRDKNLKRQIFLYKKGNMKELIKKKEENEQVILRDINRRIKSIYDSFKNNNI